MKNLFFYCAIIAVWLTGCSKVPVVDVKAEAEALRNLEEQWNAAAKVKDADKMLSFFSSDAVSMPSGKPVVTGKEAIRERMVKMLADTTYLFDTYSATIEVIEVSTSGDLAYVRGSDRLNIKTAEGIKEDLGKWIDIWKKVDGEWKCVVGIGNPDK